jgi:hypothetical protein
MAESDRVSNTELGSRTTIIYGDSGIGKSHNAALFARLMYEWYGRPVCLVAAEASSRTHFAPLVQAGIVIPLYLNVAFALSTMRKVRKGMWPHSAPDGKTEWRPIDWAGPRAPCAYILEGLTSISELELEVGRNDGRFMREQRTDAFDEAGEHFQAASQTLYGVVQDEMLFTVRDIDALPLKRVLWTAHELKGQEEGSGDPILGPGLVGKKKTVTVKKYCATLLHFDGYPMRVEQKDAAGQATPVTRLGRRIWWMEHPDARTGIQYPAKVTVPGSALAGLYRKFPGGYFEPGIAYGTGLDLFLKVEAELVSVAADDTQTWKSQLDAARAKPLAAEAKP